MIKHTVGKREPSVQTPMELLRLWTQKESIFKRKSKRGFNPLKIKITDDTASCKLAHESAELLCSLSGSDVEKSFFYYYNGEEASRVKDIVWI